MGYLLIYLYKIDNSINLFLLLYNELNNPTNFVKVKNISELSKTRGPCGPKQLTWGACTNGNMLHMYLKFEDYV